MKLNLWLLIAILFLFLATAVAADTVVFKTERRLTGKVIPPEEGDETVTVILSPDEEDPSQSGSIVLQMDTIDYIEYDYESLNASLADDDYLGHYDLGVWCIDRQLYDKALDQLLYVNGMPKVPPEASYYLGVASENQIIPKLLEAKGYYLDYLDKTKQGKFEKEANEGFERVAGQIEKLGLEEKEAVEVESTEGLEVGNWRTPRWGNSAVLTTPELKGNTKNQLLRVIYSGTDAKGDRLTGKDEAKTPIQLALNQDLSATPVLSFLVYNPEETSMDISVALTTGSNYEWFECATIPVPPKKWKSVRLDATFNTWGTEENGFAPKLQIENLDKARNLLILIRNQFREGKLYFDAIEFKE